jgi:hypothetical protein
MLKEMSCSQAQGYFYSRPLKLAELEIFAAHASLPSASRTNLDSSNPNLSELSQSVLSSLAKL